MSLANSLYGAPAVLTAELFALLPGELRQSDVRTSWADANKRGEALHSFLASKAHASTARGGSASSIFLMAASFA